MATPRAERTPGCSGIRIRGMPRSSANSQACMGPAPPKGISVNCLGSCPLSRDIDLIARSILEFTTRIIPSAAVSLLVPISFARLSSSSTHIKSYDVWKPRLHPCVESTDYTSGWAT